MAKAQRVKDIEVNPVVGRVPPLQAFRFWRSAKCAEAQPQAFGAGFQAAMDTRAGGQLLPAPGDSASTQDAEEYFYRYLRGDFADLEPGV